MTSPKDQKKKPIIDVKSYHVVQIDKDRLPERMKQLRDTPLQGKDGTSFFVVPAGTEKKP